MRKLLWTLLLIALLVGAAALFVNKVGKMIPKGKMPPATEVLMSKIGEADRDKLRALFLVSNAARGTRVTGFLTSDGVILTDAHAVSGARPGEITVLSSKGEPVKLRGMEVDRGLDVAFLLPADTLKGGLELGDGVEFGPGDQVYAWGFADGFEPPQPLLCMGFVAGYHLPDQGGDPAGPTRLVLGGPFTPAHAGAPVFRWRDNQMVGVLVTRPSAPVPLVERALEALRRAKPGEPVTLKGDDGKDVTLDQAALLALVLKEQAADPRPPVTEVVPLAPLKARLEDVK